MENDLSPNRDMEALAAFLPQLYEKYLPLTEGSTTDILPHLQAADPNCFAIAAVSVDGTVYSAGRSR